MWKKQKATPVPIAPGNELNLKGKGRCQKNKEVSTRGCVGGGVLWVMVVWGGGGSRMSEKNCPTERILRKGGGAQCSCPGGQNRGLKGLP